MALGNCIGCYTVAPFKEEKVKGSQEIITALVKIQGTKPKQVICMCMCIQSEKQTLSSGNYKECHIYSFQV